MSPMHVNVDVALAMRLDVDRGKNKNSKLEGMRGKNFEACSTEKAVKGRFTCGLWTSLGLVAIQQCPTCRFNAAPVNLKGNVEREKESVKRWITYTRRGLRELPPDMNNVKEEP